MNSEILKRDIALLTDYYELLMMQGIFLEGENTYKKESVFDMFYRKNPCGNGFSIFAGLEELVDYIENLKFTDEDIEYLKSKNVFTDEFLNFLKTFHFTGSIYAFEEGSVIFPKEPLTVKLQMIYMKELKLHRINWKYLRWKNILRLLLLTEKIVGKITKMTV